MLNDSERRRLEAIEAALIGDDPSLARRLGGRSGASVSGVETMRGGPG